MPIRQTQLSKHRRESKHRAKARAVSRASPRKTRWGLVRRASVRRSTRTVSWCGKVRMAKSSTWTKRARGTKTSFRSATTSKWISPFSTLTPSPKTVVPKMSQKTAKTRPGRKQMQGMLTKPTVPPPIKVGLRSNRFRTYSTLTSMRVHLIGRTQMGPASKDRQCAVQKSTEYYCTTSLP